MPQRNSIENMYIHAKRGPLKTRESEKLKLDSAPLKIGRKVMMYHKI